ncbi:MAG: pantetheine-phosphate adenylyltransferase [Candidatus Chisholmbacteria bacterium]|nr:pantetheine-phosphate adenylyltransferase [Candidatus Chisholmbacteria bacterium]
MKKRTFPIAIAAGSWDHFHEGHKQFLKKAFSVAEEVWVGVTAPELTRNKPLAATIESLATRQERVKKFVKSLGMLHRAKFFRLEDIFGPAIEPRVEGALLVSAQTIGGGKAVNDKRQELGLAPLQLIKVPFFMAEDGKPLSSERIRRGEVDRNGLIYRGLFARHDSFWLPVNLRPRLRRPLGTLVPHSQVKNHLRASAGMRAVVGDVVTRLFLRNQIQADLFIVDLRVERRKKYSSLDDLGFSAKREVVKVRNEAGTVTGEIHRAIERAIKKSLQGQQKIGSTLLRHSRISRRNSLPLIIMVEGEEDLAVLPVVLALPLGAQVFYGQPGEGVVIVDVTEGKKEEADELLRQFTPTR